MSFDGWKKESLWELGTVLTGKWDANHATDDGAYRFFTCAAESMKCDTSRFSGPCMILPGNGANVGDVYFYDGEFDAYQRTYVVGDIKIEPRFLFYHLQAFWRLRNEKKQFGSATNYIKMGNFKDYVVTFPECEAEQKRIVSILDEAFSAIAKAKENAEKNLLSARELFESYLNRVFTQQGPGWQENKIPEVCLIFGRGKSRHRPRNEPSLYGGPYPFIQTGDVSKADHVIRTFKQTYSEKGLEQSKLWPKGTVGIAIVGATIGETGILNFDACFPDSVIAMSVDPKLADPFFIEYMLCNFKDLVKSQGEGSARDNINLGTFDKLTFPMPPAEEQTELVARFQEVAAESTRLETIYTQKLANLDELKQSLLQKAFTGQLTAREEVII